jgi:hypothetical protein
MWESVRRRAVASGLWDSDEDPTRRQSRGEALARRFIRTTGRVSLTVFLVPFTGRALERLDANRLTRALAGRRFEALAGMAAVELVHGLGIVSLLVVYTREDRRLPPVTLFDALGGAVGYGMLMADVVAATPSFERANPEFARRVGQLADWYLYAVFAADALEAATRRARPPAVYVPMAAALMGAAAIRAAAAVRPAG